MFSLDYKNISVTLCHMVCRVNIVGGTGYTGKLYKAATGTLTWISHIGNEIPKTIKPKPELPE